MRKDYCSEKNYSPLKMDTIEEKKRIHDFESLSLAGNVMDNSIKKELEHIR
ncbi:MAG: hypothetical protein AB2421_15790 [Thermotaleaceae bacterium]